jgi:hypothetical protein
MKNACKILVRKPGWKRSLGKTGHRWEENIRMDVGEIGWKLVDWIHVDQDRDQWQALVNTFRFHKRCGIA